MLFAATRLIGMASPAHHPDFYRNRYPRSEDLDALIWAWENVPEIRHHFHADHFGPWGGWGAFSRAAAGQPSIPPDRVELAQGLLRAHGGLVEQGARRVHFTRQLAT